MTISLDHRKGLLITAIGGLTLTVDIPLIRLADGDPWTILLLRSGATLIATLAIWLIWRKLRGDAPALIPGRAGLVVAALYAGTSIAFMMAVFNTSTADLVFILAFNTMFAALLSWLLLKERPRPATLVAMAVMLLCVLVIVYDGVGTGKLLGNLLALGSSFLLASAITVTRRSGQDMGFTALVAVSAPLVIAVFMVAKTGYNVEAPWWIIFNGAVIMPVSFFCLATGPKYLSGPEVAMFYLLETVLAPIWVWMIFSEAPTAAVLAGGAVLIATLLTHSLWQLNDSRRRRAALAVRHPA
ncbi:DMT family transporter [Nitratireductor mangrovi]|uniref:DMT family transporter n=1 Tax=Nitratireductor mangrovi TaxID=2599600 RepID=A0A5B8KZD4_9HYPH|nr:DMT family transporter [Nitratireductor mangrovi]QDZ00936.1 DMT family transporter [Nitratireductor mangrovi]